MTSRERVLAAIFRRPVDRVPVGDFHFTDDLVVPLLGLPPGSPISLTDRRRCLEGLGCDMVGGYPLLPGKKRLLFLAGAKGKGNGRGSAAKRFGLPEPKELDWSEVHFWARESEQLVLGVVPGVFGEPAYMLGFEEFLIMTSAEPEAVATIAAEMVEYNLEYAARCVEAGADALLVGDDVATDDGMFFAPDRWRQLFLPYLADQVDRMRQLGVPVFYHADGNINAILGDLVATGIDGLHSLKPTAGMDLAQVKAKWGDRLCLWGNLDLGFPLTLGTMHELVTTVEKTIATGWQGGGYIFGTCSGCLDGDVTPQRVAVMYSAAAGASVRPGGQLIRYTP